MKIIPFIRTCRSDEGLAAASKREFKPTKLKVDELPNGFIKVRYEWNSTHEMKYTRVGGKMFTSDATSIEVEFPEVRYRCKVENSDINFKVEIGIKNDSSEKLPYDALFVQNFKYGVDAYFAPADWKGKLEDWKTICETKLS